MNTSLEIIDRRSQVCLHQQVHLGHEWMTVTIACRDKLDAVRGPGRSLLLQLNTSFGAFGYHWPCIPARQAERALDDAMSFLQGLARDLFVTRILGEDFPEPDYDGTLLAYETSISSLLSDLDPASAEATQIRLLHLQVQAQIEEIDEGLSDGHKIELFLAVPQVWELFPASAYELRREGPSRRRRQAEGFYDRLWHPFLAELAQEAGQ